MRYDTDRLIFSPSDLLVFLDGDFPSWMDRWHLEFSNGNASVANELGLPLGLMLDAVTCVPNEKDDELQLIAAKGAEHETTFLKQLRDEGHEVVEIDDDVPPKRQVELTVEAMRRGAAIIYQGRLEHEQFAGFSDFLVRQPGKSSLGDHHYEVWDTKLARSVKPYFIIQLCSYSEMLQAVQGRLPDSFSVVLGNGQRERRSVQKFLFYFRCLRQYFVNFHQNFSPDGFRHPGLCRGHGRWSTFAQSYLEATDHLSRVANITHTQIKKIEAAGIGTLTELARTGKRYVPRLAQPVFERLKAQARLQLESRGKTTPLCEVRPLDPDDQRRGLSLLPPPSPGDVYFDIEGFPLAADGLEYLFGALCFERGDAGFCDWWAHDQEYERVAFEKFVDWLYARWQDDPSMHVYHYASYEAEAMRRLMGKHATREREVDDLLRNHVFVDLYSVVRQGLVIGAAGYSLKDIECLYMKPREGKVTTAGGSIVAYHAWMESSESENWRKSPLLKEIRDYNRLDCESIWKLAEWLRGLQLKCAIEYIPPKPPPEKNVDEDAHPSTLLAEKLLQQVNSRRISDPVRSEVLRLLAYLLEYHWREAKPVFWRMFARHEMTEQDLIDDFDCLGGIERTSKPPQQVKRSRVYEYRFDPDQDTKLHEGTDCYFAHDLSVTTTIEALDTDRGIVEIKLGPKREEPPDRLSLIPNEYVSADTIAKAVFRYVEAWSQGTILAQAVDDLLHRRPPRLKRHHGGPIISGGADLLQASVDVIRRMKETVLCIQGPPGTGKTFTAAQAILGLLQDGKRIGVTANSHKAILNVLRAVHEAMKVACTDFRIVKVGNSADDPLIENGTIEHIASAQDACNALGQGSLVMGGTAWLFSRPELQGAFDYLFIDEAGQFSLANTIAVGLAAKNLVLVGDQMQLAQPVLGTHPGESGESALNYLLAGHATIPPELGIFLDNTWRLHPDICGFVSAAVYEGRLRSHRRTASQRIKTNGELISKEAGIVFIPVEHEGNSQGSEEEASMIEQIVDELVGCRVWDAEDSKSRKLTMDDILLVAPFNMQVRLLKKRLGPEIHVGSVDKFQGQEAHVVIVSMCSSTLEDSPRGAEFLLEPNRLNVAISRAKSLAIIVGNPDLIAARCRTIREMELVNLFCWLLDYSQREE
jgi:uncharacterized protein